jgi:hypothetical protein
MSGYSAEQIRGCRCSSRPQVILSVVLRSRLLLRPLSFFVTFGVTFNSRTVRTKSLLS